MPHLPIQHPIANMFSEMVRDQFRSAELRVSTSHVLFCRTATPCPLPPAGELCFMEEGDDPEICKNEVDIRGHSFPRMKRLPVIGIG